MSTLQLNSVVLRLSWVAAVTATAMLTTAAMTAAVEFQIELLLSK